MSCNATLMTRCYSRPAVTPVTTKKFITVIMSNEEETAAVTEQLQDTNIAEQNGAGQEKSKNQLKNEAKKAAKLEKFAAKQAKVAAVAPSEKKKESKISNGSSAIEVPETPVGQKKNMIHPMPSAYEPKLVEASWYSWWQASGFFKPEHGKPVKEKKGTFTMILPPPNVTGSLHLGHAMMGSIEDSLARWHRMRGEAVLFLPGCDHAGIATQAVVEKKLKRESNLSKFDLGREEFVRQVWKWKEQYGSRIYEQLKRMGLSLDWDRARFTLDSGVNESVNEAFCRLFEEGLIFRANRLVNWSGKLKTALSDLEVDMKEIGPRTWLPAHNHDPKKQYPFGVMWSFAYKVEGGEEGEEIVIQTTRPETLFADTAIAVNPKDQRYIGMHDKRVIHPITNQTLPVICDESADPEFGTGALKISPAHDPTDFIVGQRHNLPFVSVFDENNCLNHHCGPEYEGMQRYDARLKIIEEAKAKGVYRGDRDHPMVLPVCSRSGDFVEPRMMPQWWLNCKSMADQSLEAVEKGLLELVPEAEVKVWNNWLVNIRDWCLSRQLWWGHQIPAYQLLVDGKQFTSVSSEPVWVVGRTEEEALQRARAIHPQATIRRDPDVLDTWFSSGLWPFSTMGWPKQSEDMSLFYPNSLLETGSDILFFWVARMVMLGVHLTGQVPFKACFLHSIVRDAHGRKMSKSLGNVIDPIDVIEGITLENLHQTLANSNLDPTEVEKAKKGQRLDFPNGIPECGTDALRFALCSYVAHSRDVNMNVNEVHAMRRFCNKIWQASRFAFNYFSEGYQPCDIDIVRLGPFDRWILGRLSETIKLVNEGFESYVLMTCTRALYSFWLNDLCDVYIEAIKPIMSGEDVEASRAAKAVLFKCIHDGLLLLHPMMPFVTEELYQRLPYRSSESACIAAFPEPSLAGVEADLELVLSAVKEIRSIAAADSLIPKGTRIVINPQECKVFEGVEASVASLVKAVGTLVFSDDTHSDCIVSKAMQSVPVQVAFYPKPN